MGKNEKMKSRERSNLKDMQDDRITNNTSMLNDAENKLLIYIKDKQHHVVFFCQLVAFYVNFKHHLLLYFIIMCDIF